MTARLATHVDVLARAPDVLERLLRAGVEVEGSARSTPGAADADPLAAVRDGHADLALVGLDALRGSAADDLAMVAALPREDPRDVLVRLRGGPKTLRSHPGGARVALRGPRRGALLRIHRPDLTAAELPDGALHDLAAEAEAGTTGFDAAVVAAWEARRCGLADRMVEMLDVRSWLPAPGQGIVALVARHPVAEVTVLDHLPTRTALRAELALVDALDLGPDVPFGAVAQPSGRLLRIWAAVLSPDGSRLVRSDLTGPLDEPEVLGIAVARQLTRRGADLVAEGAAS